MGVTRNVHRSSIRKIILMRKYKNGKQTAFGGTISRRERHGDGRRQTYARIRNSKFVKTVERFTTLWPRFGGSLKIKFSDSSGDGLLDTITPNRRARSLGQIEIPPNSQWIEWGTGTIKYKNLTNNWSTYK